MTLTPILCGFPVNFGTASRYSWIPIQLDIPDRPLFAQASYTTNFFDLGLSLSEQNLNLGAIQIVDNDSGLRCDVISFSRQGSAYNALRVITQNLEPQYDTVSLADKEQNNVSVYPETSSLQVHLTNFGPLTSLIEREFNETQSFLDSLTSIQVDKQSQIITLLHQLTANTDELEINLDNLEINTDGVETLLASLTALNQREFDETQTLLNSLTAKDYATATNQAAIITLLNSLTSGEHSLNLNTDDVEFLLSSANTLSVILTANTDAINTQLSILTATGHDIISNQEVQNTLLSALTAKEYDFTLNIANIDLPTLKIETLLDSLTSINQREFDETQTLLDSLTGLQDDRQNQIIALLHQLTAITAVEILNPVTAFEILNVLDISGNVTITNPVTAVEISNVVMVSVTNPLTSIEIINALSSFELLNPVTAVEILNPISAFDILNVLDVSGNITIANPVTAVEILNPVTAFDIMNVLDVSGNITIANPITAIEILNSITAVEILNPVTAFDILNVLDVSGNIIIANPVTAVEILNPVSAFDILNVLDVSGNIIISNPVTAVEILNPVTAIDVLNTVAVSGSITVLNPVSSVSITNQLTGLTILNPVTAIDVLNTVAVSGSVTVTNPTTGVQVLNSVALKDLNNNNVTVTPATSSLNVNVTNPIVATVDPSVGFPVSFAQSPNFDAFGRLRTSSPLTLFDSSHRYRDNNLWSTLSANGGSVSFNQNQGLIDMTVSNLSGSTVIRETTKVFSYQPGKGILVMNTFVMAPSAQNLRQRVGYFGQDNGMYFQLDGGTISLVERSLVNGSPSTETIVPLSAWNGDKLDGTGPSKLTLDITKAQIQWMDIEWLGVGTVRCGFVINGQFITCHSFHHANLIPSTYITTASLPLRYEVTNKDSTVGSHTLKQICSTVISEGGYELRGLQQAIGIPITSPRTFAATNTYYPIISIRLKASPDRLDAVVILTALSILGSGNGINYNWQVRASGVTSGGSWIDAGTDSAVEYNISGTSYAGGRILASGFLNASNQASPNLDILKEALFKFQLERNNLTKTPFEITLVAATDTVNGSGMFASMDWEEISR